MFPSAVAKNNKVIGIPRVGKVRLSSSPSRRFLLGREPGVPLHVLVKFMEVDVGEERAYDASLWRAQPRVLEQPSFHDAGPQEFPDQVDHLSVRDTSPQQLGELPVVDRVEVRADVALNDPETLL